MATNPNRTSKDLTTPSPEILFRRDQEAQQLWADCYESLSYREPGLRGAATSRGEAQVLRLSALYAALDSSEMVCLPHLEAAYAVWTCCYRSAVRLFGLATGDPIADRIREPPKPHPTASQGIRSVVSSNKLRNHLRKMNNQTSRSYLAYLAYLAFLSIFFQHESDGRGAYLSFLSQSAFFFRNDGSGCAG
jgi:hypothetical protein